MEVKIGFTNFMLTDRISGYIFGKNLYFAGSPFCSDDDDDENPLFGKNVFAGSPYVTGPLVLFSQQQDWDSNLRLNN